MCQNITSQDALHRVWNIYSFIKEAKAYGKECVNHIHSTYMKSYVKQILREMVKKKKKTVKKHQAIILTVFFLSVYAVTVASPLYALYV